MGEIRAAMNPITVIGATTGAAKRFAGIAISDNKPEMAIITGVHIIVAEIGIASNSDRPTRLVR